MILYEDSYCHVIHGCLVHCCSKGSYCHIIYGGLVDCCGFHISFFYYYLGTVPVNLVIHSDPHYHLTFLFFFFLNDSPTVM